MDKTTQLIASKARKVVRHVFRKRKRTRLLKVSSSLETALSANVVPPKLKRSSVDNMDIRLELQGSSAPVASQQTAPMLQTPYVQRFWEGRGSRSSEDVQKTQITARKLVELQLDNDRLRREVRDLEKKVKDTNRQLKQEREFYEEQRWSYVQEIRATIKETSSTTTQTKEYIESDDDDDDTLAHELRRVREMFYKQRDNTCRLSEKFLRLRDDRDRLSGRLKRLEIVYSTVIDELLKHIAEVRVYFASIKKGVLLERSAVASLVDRNAKLGYNNAVLQLEILKYEKKLEAIKKQAVDCTDGYEVEKFLARCRSSRLLAVCGGGGDNPNSSSVQVTRRGSLINIPVAVLNGNRVETKLAPLFSVVRLRERDSNEDELRGNRTNLRVRKTTRRAKSVPSKVWRVKYNSKMPRRAMRSAPNLRRKPQDESKDSEETSSTSSCD
ncbi:hypothetical protein GE061_007870 [Apolygus lucorum]|uniref:Uncharacterized protein n=1 Tax=Apolygus lucorum TaxID=248454 RepID=A0A8S9WN34_APOLU|nr:hypothetical protein GE061_007870 [Apolygus lucorum]